MYPFSMDRNTTRVALRPFPSFTACKVQGTESLAWNAFRKQAHQAYLQDFCIVPWPFIRHHATPSVRARASATEKFWKLTAKQSQYTSLSVTYIISAPHKNYNHCSCLAIVWLAPGINDVQKFTPVIGSQDLPATIPVSFSRGHHPREARARTRSAPNTPEFSARFQDQQIVSLYTILS